MLSVYDAFVQEDIQQAGELIGNVDAGLLDAQTKGIYNRLDAQINEQYIAVLYTQAEQAYNTRNFPEAIPGLTKVVETDEDYQDGYAIYYLAQSCRQTGDVENAKKYYQRMIELHPGTQRARSSQRYLEELNQQP